MMAAGGSESRRRSGSQLRTQSTRSIDSGRASGVGDPVGIAGRSPNGGDDRGARHVLFLVALPTRFRSRLVRFALPLLMGGLRVYALVTILGLPRL